NVYAEKGAELPELEILPGFDEHATASVMRALLPVLIEEEPALAIDAEKLFESKRSFQMVFERVMLRWISGKDRIPDVESWEDFNARVRNALREIMVRSGRGHKVAVVASGGSISASVRYAMGISDETAMRLSWQIANTAFTRFKYTAERITLDGFNCYGHLECSGVEGILTYR
ncbi:MAG TPA: histidine phosphatase family protein, partial [Spirochaetota bacterium]|nr:histidine phosphatase family protein [Spirochaetota bacterium]